MTLRLSLLKTLFGWMEKPKSLCSAFRRECWKGCGHKLVQWHHTDPTQLFSWHRTLTAKCQNYYVPRRFSVITITAVRLTQKSAPTPSPPPQPLRPSPCCWFLLIKLSVRVWWSRVSTFRDRTWQSTHQQWVGTNRNGKVMSEMPKAGAGGELKSNLKQTLWIPMGHLGQAHSPFKAVPTVSAIKLERTI